MTVRSRISSNDAKYSGPSMNWAIADDFSPEEQELLGEAVELLRRLAEAPRSEA